MQLMRKLAINARTFPWFLLGVAVFAFGLLIPSLGFYQDDWHHIYYYARAGNEGLRLFLAADSRPFAFVVYQPLFRLLGLNPLGWHILMLILRYLTALVFLKGINLIWPQSSRVNMLAAVLFMLYPAYMLQSMSVMFALHWTMYLVYLFSIWAMILSFKQPRSFLLLTIASLVLVVFHLLMLEYFAGLELLRPVFIFLALGALPMRERVRQTFKGWLPYLLTLVVYVVFRSSFSQMFGHDRNVPVMLLGLFSQPLATLGFLFQAGLQDFVQIVIASWYEILQPSFFTFDRMTNVLIWLVTLVSFIAGLVYFTRMQVEEAPDRESTARQMIWLGVFAVLCGVLPGWAVGETVSTSNPLWNDRFAMASLFGAALTWVGLLTLFVQVPARRIVFFSILAALCIGGNIRTAIGFKQSWETQQHFYWQLFWRAPYIEPATAFISDSEFLSYMGVYPTSFAINTLYSSSGLNYLFYASGERTPDWKDFRSGVPLQYRLYASEFNGFSTDSLAVHFATEKQKCLWVLSPVDLANRSLPTLAYEYIPVSNLDRIRPLTAEIEFPNQAVFGKEPAHDWCYFFERADLARQYGDWDEIASLWNEAVQTGQSADIGYELTPFIVGHARANDWETARLITLHADRITGKMPPYLCSIWDSLEKDTPASPERDDMILKVREKLHCGEE